MFKMFIRNNASLGLFAAALLVSPLGAQTDTAPTDPAKNRTVTDICSTIPPLNDSAVRPLIELVLTPGDRIDPSKIPPDAMAKVAALQKASLERQAKDWANLCRYAADNAAVQAGGKTPRTIFHGDSITEYWQRGDPAMFGETVLDRGISGQTTAQILHRFYPDVIALKPRVVHIMAGTNDVAGNLGPVSDDTIIDNITAMIDIAKANGIKVVLASIPPAKFLSWKPGVTPAARIIELNRRLRALAKTRAAVFVDYHSQLKDDQDGFQTALANDGVHPNRNGYAIMRPMAERAIAQAERKRK